MAIRTLNLRVFIILFCTVIWAAIPLPVQAALGISSVQPTSVSNATSVDLIVTGTDFLDGAVVLLENYGALATVYVSPTVLRAALPAGLTPGVYTVLVINPDSTTASLPGGLTVTEPTIPAVTPTTQVNGTPTPPIRPLIVVDSYGAGVGSVSPTQEIELVIRLHNVGERVALNLVAVFAPGDFIPRASGGVLAMTELDPGEKKRFNQPLTATYDIMGKLSGTVVMQISYTDATGAAYSETFNLTIPVTPASYRPSATPTVTPTPTSVASLRPQLVITGYNTSVPVLQPGSRFNLLLQVVNLGNDTASRVTMILGGGSSSGGNAGGTPDVGGVSGASGDFGNFAPVAASNVQFLGDLQSGASQDAQAALIVNASTNPGAYPMKISFTYVDRRGNIYTDDQVVTLLVYSLPQVEVNFYRTPDPFFAGQPGQLPLQVVNLGRKAVILGNMRVSAEGVDLQNNVILVGTMDIGMYFTLDATVIPFAPGPLDLQITIDYTDDFNQPQVISRTVSIDVEEMSMPEPGNGDGFPGGGEPMPEVQPETFWQKLVRFLKGLFGLDSGVPTPGPGEFLPGEMPPGEVPPEQSVPVPARKG